MLFNIRLKALNVRTMYRHVTHEVVDDVLDYIEHEITVPVQSSSYIIVIMSNDETYTFSISQRNCEFIKEILEVAGYRAVIIQNQNEV